MSDEMDNLKEAMAGAMNAINDNPIVILGVVSNLMGASHSAQKLKFSLEGEISIVRTNISLLPPGEPALAELQKNANELEEEIKITKFLRHNTILAAAHLFKEMNKG